LSLLLFDVLGGRSWRVFLLDEMVEGLVGGCLTEARPEWRGCFCTCFVVSSFAWFEREDDFFI